MKRLILLQLIVTGLAGLAAVAGLVPAAFSAQNAQSVQTIRVTETSYRIKLSAVPRAGATRFVIRNASDDGHDFWVRGGGKTYKSRVLGEGSSAALGATLRKGVRYAYWCGVGSHRSKGMSGSFVAR
ncbi:MAG: hypothetical protein ACR2GT_03825 [Gaiellaceae bacterium]